MEPESELGEWLVWSAAAQAALRAGELRLSAGQLHCVAPAAAARAISLRDIDRQRVRVVQLEADGTARPHES